MIINKANTVIKRLHHTLYWPLMSRSLHTDSVCIQCEIISFLNFTHHALSKKQNTHTSTQTALLSVLCSQLDYVCESHAKWLHHLSVPKRPPLSPLSWLRRAVMCGPITSNTEPLYI